MEKCESCGVSKHPDAFIRGLCFDCRALQKRGTRSTESIIRSGAQRAENIVLTTETNLNVKIEKRIEIISAECAFGMNIFKDFFSGVRDIFGGRSKSIQNTLRDARKTVLNELKNEALSVGANAVVAVNLDYSEISGGGKSMLFLVATGTAVIIAQNESSNSIAS